MSRDPNTPAEWQEAVDAAWLMLALDSCRQYGLIEWDAQVDFDRCERILAAGKARGFIPNPKKGRL